MTISLRAFLYQGAIVVVPAMLGWMPLPLPVRASVPAVADPCATPLPILLAAESGGATLRFVELRGGGNSFELIQFPDGLRAALRQLHANGYGPAPLPGDMVGRFTFTVGTTAYLGPVHVFRHGSVQHLCLGGNVAVERVRGGMTFGPARIVPVRIDGTLTGAFAHVTLTVGQRYYYVFGLTHTR